MLPIDPATLQYHARLIHDRVRTRTFRQAIVQVVRPGDIVVDVGTGTGILACYAAAAGAAKVYAIERGEVADLATHVIEANRMDDRVVLIRGAAGEVELPEPADVLVSETLWNGGVGEGLPALVEDARRRFLRPGARLIPRSFRLVAALVAGSRVRRRVDQWEDTAGLDLTCGRSVAANLAQPFKLRPDEIMTASVEVAEVDLAGRIDEHIRGRATVSMERACGIDGLGLWFEAVLAPGVEVTNPPGADSSWHQVLLPFEQPAELGPGEAQAWVDVLNGGALWRWGLHSLHVERAQSMFRADLRPLDALRRSSTAYVPEQTEKVAAARFLLERVDGRRSARELGDEVRAHFQDLFVSEEHARTFVRATLANVT